MLKLFNENNKYETPKREWTHDYIKIEDKLNADINNYGLEKALDIYNIENNASHIKLECLSRLINQTSIGKPGDDITLTREQVDYLFRGILDMLNHLPNELPYEVYLYMNNKMIYTFIDIIKQLNKK